MKLFKLAAASILLSLLAACSTTKQKSDADSSLIVGAANTTSTSCYTVTKDGVQQFQSANVATPNSTTYNFSGACGTVPPPNDPGALTYAQIIYNDHGVWRPVNNVDVRDFGNIVGRIGAVNPPPFPIFPYMSGSTWKITMPANKILRSRITVPVNTPTNLIKHLTTVSYGPSPGAHVRAAIVPAGAPWPTSTVDTGCYKHDLTFTDQNIFIIVTNPNNVNNYFCKTLPGQSYDLLIGTVNPALGATFTFWWTG